MRIKPIGKTGLHVTEIGFGTSGLGSMPDTYGYEVSEDRARETLSRIFAGPANLIDTSRIYGFGRSEQRIGDALAELGGLPVGFVLSTKLDRDVASGRFDGDQARRSLDESLEALRLDHVPMMHLHDPEHAANLDEITRKGGAIDTLLRMKDEGLVVAVGLAMGRLDIMEPLVKAYPFDAIMNHNRFTVLNRAADALFDHCYKSGIAILNAAPYAGGVLAKGSATMPRVTYQLADDASLAPIRAIEALCARYDVAPGALALQFSMRDPRITSTVCGVSSPQRIQQTLEWASAPIPAALWDELAQFVPTYDDPEATRDYRPG